MKKNNYLKYYLLSIGFISVIIFIFDLIVMPIYVRHGDGNYMVNVKNKDIKYAIEILDLKVIKELSPIHFILL